MTKPSHGDPSRDERIQNILDNVSSITDKDIRNLDFKTLSCGKSIFNILASKFDRQKDIVFEKKIGGHKGGSHSK